MSCLYYVSFTSKVVYRYIQQLGDHWYCVLNMSMCNKLSINECHDVESPEFTIQFHCVSKLMESSHLVERHLYSIFVIFKNPIPDNNNENTFAITNFFFVLIKLTLGI